MSKSSNEPPAAAIKRLASSIAKYGMNAPIVIDANGDMVCRSRSWLATKRLGLREVPVIRMDRRLPSRRR